MESIGNYSGFKASKNQVGSNFYAHWFSCDLTELLTHLHIYGSTNGRSSRQIYVSECTKPWVSVGWIYTVPTGLFDIAVVGRKAVDAPLVSLVSKRPDGFADKRFQKLIMNERNEHL